MNNTIDAVDYAILKCLDENGGCWKKRAHEWITAHMDELPNMSEKSLQTIGRRIDELHAAGEVESCILSPDAVDRDMIIGYTLTEQGEETLAARRSKFLRDYVVKAREGLLTEEQTEMSVERAAVIALMTDEFDIDEETRTEILPQIETEELAGLLAAHLFLDNTESTFNPDNEDALAAFLRRTPTFRRPFEKKNIIARIRERLAAEAENVSERVKSAE